MNGIVKKTRGDCEMSWCDKTDVDVYVMHGNILMCEECKDKETLALEKNRHASAVIAESRKLDDGIELSQELFNAGTKSFAVIQSAIQNNSEIPAEQKNYAVIVEVAARVEKLTKAIFDEEAALLAKKNERHALTVNIQTLAAVLHGKEREKWIKESEGKYEVNYKPQTPKTVKPRAVRTTKKFNKEEVYEAAKKYNVPASAVQGYVVSRGISAEEAAKHVASLIS